MGLPKRTDTFGQILPTRYTSVPTTQAGTMGASALLAIINAPGAALPSSPVLLRVPSGKIANTPSLFKRSMPCLIAALSLPPRLTGNAPSNL